MTIRLRIANEDPPGGDKVVCIVHNYERPPYRDIRLSGSQSVVFFLQEGTEIRINETGREPCDGPAAPKEEDA